MDTRDNCDKIDCQDAFKNAFKNYKRKCPPPDLSSVIDFRNLKEKDLIEKVIPAIVISLGYLKFYL